MRVLQFLRSRIAVVVAALLLCGALAWGYSLDGDIESAWGELAVPTQPITFGDLKAVTGCIDCVIAGLDPYVEANHCYPMGGRFNLPRAWLWLRYMGVNGDTADATGVIYMLLLLAAFLLIFRTKTWFGGIAAVLGILSPPVLLGMERGNGDVLIFSLLVIALSATMRLAPGPRRYVVGGFLAFLTAMKIYPAVAAAAIVRTRKDVGPAALIAVVGVAALLLTSWSVLGEVYRNTPTVNWFAFGNINIFVAMIGLDWISAPDSLETLHVVVDLVTIAVIVNAAILALYLRSRRSGFFPRLDPDNRCDVVAVAALAVFCFVFCLGSSYNYRLLYLLAPLAALVKAHDEAKHPAAKPAIIVLLAFLWLSGQWLYWPIYGFALFYEPLDWLVFIGAGSWLFVTLWDRVVPQGGRARAATP